MPPYTETGTNNIAFTIDGQVWVNNLCYFDNFLQPQAYKSSVYYHPDEHYLSINAESYPRADYNEQFYIEIPTDGIKKPIKVSFDNNIKLYGTNGFKPPKVNKLSILRFDTLNKIFSGKYDLFIYKHPSKVNEILDSVHIIGFFDCKEGQH